MAGNAAGNDGRYARGTWSRRARHAAEGLLLRGALGFFRALPIEVASRLGARIARAVAPSSRSRIAEQNLALAIPELDRDQRAAVVGGVWENVGRTLGEFAHLDRIYPAGRVEIRGEENVIAARDDGIGGIFFSAHYGNWELLSVALVRYGIAPVPVYRPANSAGIERAIQRRRLAAHPIEGVEYLPKTGRGMRGALRALREGRHLAMLLDQKMNRGAPVPFFGRDAMTAMAAAEMAVRYRVPLIPSRIERLPGARFRLTVLPPMALPESGDGRADALALMRAVHALFEDWIRERPDHWLWLHRRWPRDESARRDNPPPSARSSGAK